MTLTHMLLRKSWLDTRWRFLIGLAILLVGAGGIVFDYVQTSKLLPALASQDIDTTTMTGLLVKAAIKLEQTYRGFIWVQWFRQNLTQMGTLFAVLLGSGSVLAGPTTGGLYSLSLPASRNQWLAVRAATGLAELFVLAVIPSLTIPLLSPLIGQHYSIVDAIVHGACFFVGGAVFFSLAFLLSTVFNDIWRPLLIVCAVAVVTYLCETILALPGLFRVMSGWNYFRNGSLPWVGLLISAAASAAVLYGATINVTRKDF